MFFNNCLGLEEQNKAWVFQITTCRLLNDKGLTKDSLETLEEGGAIDPEKNCCSGKNSRRKRKVKRKQKIRR